MKKLKEIIRESFEIEDLKNNYYMITLVRHEGLDLTNMTEDEFKSTLKDDFYKALEEYRPIAAKINARNRQQVLDRAIKNATDYANKKWKTDKRRQEYIDNAIANIDASIRYIEDPESIYFDFNPGGGKTSTQSISVRNIDDRTLHQIYEDAIKDKYFKRGIGWAFKYETRDPEYPHITSRPRVDILLNESDSAERKRDEQELIKAVNDFYKNTKYWGD